jgi:3-phosphoshikimate 1-carboxyvinyltransferase
MKNLIIKPPGHAVKCEITLPASKSISNRLLIMKQLSGDKIQISNLSAAGDTMLMQKLIANINDHVKHADASRPCKLDCENAGTVLRFLAAYLSIVPGTWLLTGSERMKLRPVATLCEALKELGASVEYTGIAGFPPLIIEGRKLEGGHIRMDAAESSQFVSALMMIAPEMQAGLHIELENQIASRPYIDMTLGLMQQAGIQVLFTDRLLQIAHGPYGAASITAEPDWTSASYWYEIVAMLPGSEVLLKGLFLKSLQGDAVLADIFTNFGVGTYETVKGTLLAKKSEPQSTFSYNFSDYPDLVPAVAACCTALNIEAHLSGLKNLSIKESDRLQALKNELEKINPSITIADADTLNIGKSSEKGSKFIEFNTYNDHRMAMALAPLAVSCGQVSIENPKVAGKSYPDFWEHLSMAGFRFSNLSPLRKVFYP